MIKKTEWDETLPAKGNVAFLRATAPEREKAIIHATEFLDLLPFKGERKSDTQSLAWPRTGVFDEDGLPIRGIPQELQDTTTLVAGFILAQIPFGPPAMAWVFLKIGHFIADGFDLSGSKITWH